MAKSCTMPWLAILGLGALLGCKQVWGPFIEYQSDMSLAADMSRATDMLRAMDMTPLSVPTITQLTPSSGPTVGQTPIVIMGKDFLPGAKVTVGGQDLGRLMVVSATQITGTVPDRPGKLGPATVAVTNPDKGVASATYTYSSYSMTQFGPAVNYSTSGYSTSVAVGDFNGDGKPDLAAANAGDGLHTSTVSVLLNDGMGGFGSAVNYAVGIYPTSVAVGDFNGDGKPDLAIANEGNGTMSNTVSVLLNEGVGAFGSAANISFGALIYPHSVAAGDFNGDGTASLAIATGGNNSIIVLFDGGMGIDGTEGIYSVGSAPSSVAVGDFNGDGKPDLVVACPSSEFVSVLLNIGKDSFASAVTYSVGPTYVSVAVGDFNGDGKPDLAVAANDVGGNVIVLLNNGMGGFASAVGNYYSTGMGSVSVAVGDFNGDGKPDLAVANLMSNNVSVLLNKGDGSGSFMAAQNFDAGNGSISVAVGDFNGDGKPDLAVGNNDGVSVLLNTSQ